MAGEDERARVAGRSAVLPWRLRQVIVLRDIYDLPHGSIATELGISEAAAKVRLHRARRRPAGAPGQPAHRVAERRPGQPRSSGRPDARAS